MKFLRVLSVKAPTRGTKEAAGIDFYVPEDTDLFRQMFKDKNPNIDIINEKILIPPQGRVNIPSGIKVEIPEGYALIAYNKSGVSLKYGLDVGATVVDQDYKGIIHLSLVNTTNQYVCINFGQKIIQFLLIPINYEMPEEVNSEEELFTRESDRGDGAFGSTGSF